MQQPNFKRTRLACFTAYFTMSSIFSLPPLLLATFHEMYHVSYTLLGTLVLINFCTQLSVDLIFTAFSKHFNVQKIVRVMPLLTTLGILIYALVPTFFPSYAYLGLVIGTLVFSFASGLSEVLLSPTIAALPSDNPQRDMSMLHSLYAIGVFFVVTVGTVFLKLFGAANWMFLALFLALLPIIAAVLFMFSPMPDMSEAPSETIRASGRHRTVGLALCTACIFFGSCAENAMSNWVSGYMENALHVDKAIGDLLGMAMFAILLWIGRVGYGRFGKNIGRVLLFGMIGAAICYLLVGLSSNTVVVFVACAVTGLFTSMLWPGTLILMEERVPHAGVAAFALMAAGGDLGASVSPQLMGIVADSVAAAPWATSLGATLSMTAEQLGLKAAMLVTAIFPILGVIAVIWTLLHFKTKPTK